MRVQQQSVIRRTAAPLFFHRIQSPVWWTFEPVFMDDDQPLLINAFQSIVYSAIADYKIIIRLILTIRF